MKNLIILLLLFSFAFSSPEEEAPLSYSEKRKRMNIEINQCVNNGQVSDKVKALLKEVADLNQHFGKYLMKQILY